MSYVLTKDFVACVPVRFFFFAAAHFYLASFSLPTTSISHFLTAGRYKIFALSFQQNSSPLFFISRSFSVIHVSLDTKT